MTGLGIALEVLLGTIRDVLPIATILLVFQFVILRRALPNPRGIAIGFAYVLLGLSLFLIGLEEALFPIGRLMASQLTHPEIVGVAASTDWRDFGWIYAFAFAMGFSTTIAEPALIAVAIKASELSAGSVRTWGLRIAVAIGVAVGLTLGVFRIIIGAPIHWFIICGYIVVTIQTMFAPRSIVPLAYDSGGVTTSTVTVPIVAALPACFRSWRSWPMRRLPSTATRIAHPRQRGTWVSMHQLVAKKEKKHEIQTRHCLSQ